MTVLFMDGFDHYETVDVLKKWTSANWTPTAGTTQPGVSPAWARPPGGGQGICLLNHTLSKSFDNVLCAIVGFNFNIQAGTTATPILVFEDPAGSEQCSLRLDVNQRLTMTRNGTVLATSTNTLSIGDWNHLEVKVTVHNVSGTYECRVNGSSTGWIPAATGANTRAQTNNYFSTIMIRSGTSRTCFFDDFYVLDMVSPNNAFLGPQKISTIYPVATGSYSQWTPNYMTNFGNVNEPTADGDASFNYSSTANQIDSFHFSHLPAATIKAIQHVLEARQDSGTQHQIAPLNRRNSTDRLGTTFDLSGSHKFYLDPQDTDAEAGAAWTSDNLNETEFGYKLVS